MLTGATLYLGLTGYRAGPGNVADMNGTGAVGATGGCNCHVLAPTASTAVTLRLLSSSTAVTSYVPGHVYTLEIMGTNTSTVITDLSHYGFQACVVKAAGAGTSSAVNAGSMSGAPAGTHVYMSTPGIEIFEQFNASFGDGAIPATTGTGGTGTTYVQSVTWTAPAAGTGTVVIYGVLNAVNHNGTHDAGDIWDTATAVITEQPATIVQAIAGADNVAIYPNPATDELHVQVPQGSYSFLAVTNIMGQVERRVPLNGEHITVDIKTLPAGTYYVSLVGNAGVRTWRILKE